VPCRINPGWFGPLPRHVVLDEIGDLPLDVQPSCSAFWNSRRSCRWRDEAAEVDVRVLAATTPTWSSGWRRQIPRGPVLSLERHSILVPPLRERREEIPHLSTYFLREASERLGKPDIHLSSEAWTPSRNTGGPATSGS